MHLSILVEVDSGYFYGLNRFRFELADKVHVSGRLRAPQARMLNRFGVYPILFGQLLVS